ncbi:MAG: two-component system response regulator [Deltaproteobacteria bacterium RIFOXYD12_FULL_57_12]|nr:MAG: two-component system response regulator [Deltaproteobacteria bacterium RIFOXYD12_FULL_57_12]
MKNEPLEADILLVDDEEQFVSTLSARLQLRGLKVEAAGNGMDAMRLVGKKVFDAIVLDLIMPGIDGIETLRRMKAFDPGLQIIMLTGRGTVTAGVEAMKAGALDFLIKPLDLNTLLAKIGTAKSNRMLLI